MATGQQRRRRYELFGRVINAADAVAKVQHPLATPTTCRFCQGHVELANNHEVYGRERGWPLIYRCVACGARVGCHPDTDIPLGTLADENTQQARKAAHAAFDALWHGKTGWHRQQAYRALAKAMGVQSARIACFDAKECLRIVELCRAGALGI